MYKEKKCEESNIHNRFRQYKQPILTILTFEPQLNTEMTNDMRTSSRLLTTLSYFGNRCLLCTLIGLEKKVELKTKICKSNAKLRIVFNSRNVVHLRSLVFCQVRNNIFTNHVYVEHFVDYIKQYGIMESVID